jgi:hypothetical protein
MSNNECVLSEDILREGAFLLLSSSSMNRYLRMAQGLARASSLQARLDIEELSVRDLVARAKWLWRELLSRNQRDVPEIELAIILAALTDNTAIEVSDLLVLVSLNDRPPVTWISALARRLYQSRAENEEIILWESTLQMADVEGLAADDMAVELVELGSSFRGTIVNTFSQDIASDGVELAQVA